MASIKRIARVTIVSLVGTAAGLWLLRDRQELKPLSLEVPVTEVSYNPAMADLRLRITLNGKRGYVDGSGHVVIEPVYAMAMPFSEGLAAVADRVSADGAPSWKFVNASGVVVIPRASVGGQIGTFHEGMAPIMVTGKWGYISSKGEFVIPVQYDGAEDFREGLAAVRVGRKYGVIVQKGATVLEPTFDFIGSYSGGRAVFAQNDRFGYLDRDGRIAVAAAFNRASDFSEGLAFVAKGEGKSELGAYVDLKGDYAIKPGPFSGGPFRQGIAAIESAALGPHYIDAHGNITIKPAGVQKAGNFSEGLAPVLIDGRFGFIDLAGKVVIPPQWQFVGEFVNGACRVNSGDVRGYINTRGQYIWKLML